MSKKHRILIIDDNRSIIEAMQLFLSEKYEIATAHNGAEGLEAIEQNENGIDLVITDLIMPELSGVVLISMVKKKYPKTPVIAMTGWGDHPAALAREANADRLLLKPFELDCLEGYVAELLA